ncbi:MAG TPA: TonB family protein [Candidatus Acidoferrum sp.]|nr:TonB family protein [Candidatus Acidoferrum sp.]
MESLLIATAKQNTTIAQRRSCARTKPEEAVLVRFDGTKWGKLINISEDGMSFEFAQAPAVAKTIAFQLESMNCGSAELGETRSVVQVDGWVKWSSEFERTAGVQFVGLSTDAREQIREWFPAEACSEIFADEGDEETAQSFWMKSVETAGLRENAHAKEFSNARRADTGRSDANVERARNEMVKEQSVVEESAKPALTSNQTVVLGASACLAIVAVLTAIVVFRFTPARAAASSENRHRALAGDAAQPSGDGLPTFKVEVEEAAGGRFVLNVSSDASGRSVADNSNAEALRVAARSLAPVAAKAQAEPAHIAAAVATPATASATLSTSASETRGPLAMGAPVAINSIAAPVLATATKEEPELPTPTSSTPEASAKGPSVAESALGALRATPAPATNAAKETSAASDAVIRGGAAESLGNREKEISGYAPKPILDAVKPMRGQAQPARLIFSVPPVYPEFAKSERISGNVAIDALIDLKGKVTNMKVLSGPAALHEAAKKAVKQWRFEPARLNGEPTATHLEVTVKFTLVNSVNQPIR